MNKEVISNDYGKNAMCGATNIRKFTIPLRDTEILGICGFFKKESVIFDRLILVEIVVVFEEDYNFSVCVFGDETYIQR